MGQLLNSDLAVKVTIGPYVLGLFDVANFPQPTTADVKFDKPLQDGDFSAGGKTRYGVITCVRTFDPDTDETLLANLAALQGDPNGGAGSAVYFKAVGGNISGTPIKGQSWSVVLLTAAPDGLDSKGDKVVMMTVTLSPNGVGK